MKKVAVAKRQDRPFIDDSPKAAGLFSGKLTVCYGKCAMSSMIYLLKMVIFHFAMLVTTRG